MSNRIIIVKNKISLMVVVIFSLTPIFLHMLVRILVKFLRCYTQGGTRQK